MYKFENDEGERILSCNCTVLCYILEYRTILYKYEIDTCVLCLLSTYKHD